MAKRKKSGALSWIIKEAKHLRLKDRNRKEWKDYVAQASAIYSKKHGGKSPVGKKRSVGKTILLEKGETAKTRTKKIVRIHRHSNGTVKNMTSKNIAGITDQYRYLQNQHYLKQLTQLNSDLDRHNKQLISATADKKLEKDKTRKKHIDNYIREIKKHIAATKQRISQVKSLIK